MFLVKNFINTSKLGSVAAYIISMKILTANACGLNWHSINTPLRSLNYDYALNINEYVNNDDEVKKEYVFLLKFNPCKKAYEKEKNGGWFFPLISSKALSISDSEMEITLPDEQIIHLTKQGESYTDSRWHAQIQGDVITLKSDCGWILNYKKSLIEKITSPSGMSILILRAKDTITIEHNKKEILSIKTSGDKIRIGSNKKYIIFKPSTSSAYNDAETHVDNLIVNKIAIDLSENICTLSADKLVRWDISKKEVIEIDNTRISMIKYLGMNCIELINRENKLEISGRTEDHLREVTKSYGESLTKYIAYKIINGKKVIDTMCDCESKNGGMFIINKSKFIYDENLRLINTIIIDTADNTGVKFNNELFINEKTTSTRTRTFDKTGRLINFKNKNMNITINYMENNLIKITTTEKESTKVKIISSNDISSTNYNP